MKSITVPANVGDNHPVRNGIQVPPRSDLGGVDERLAAASHPSGS